MIFRAATAADRGDLARLIVADPASTLTVAAYRTGISRGEYRPEWTWVARDGAAQGGVSTAGGTGDGPVLAGGIWWGWSGEAAPGTLDGLFTHGSLSTQERAMTGGALIAAAHRAFAAAGGTTPDFHVIVPGDWRRSGATWWPR